MSLTLVVLMSLAAADAPRLHTLFEAREYRYTGGSYHDKLFQYRLFVPTPAPNGEKQPLLVWLHGFGEGGDDNYMHLKWLDQFVMKLPLARERYPFFVLAVQCEPENRNWARSLGKDNMVDVTAAILDDVLHEYPVDPDRVCLSGVSSGGSGSWDLVVRYPQYFSAVAPFASTGTSYPDLSKVVNVPIWAFHSTNETIASVQSVRETVKKIQDLGGMAHLTEIPSKHHDCWTESFPRYDVVNWLFSQRRGQTSWRTSVPTAIAKAQLREFTGSWTWWQAVFQVGVPVAAIVLLWRTVRRRAVRRRGTSQEALAEVPTAPADSSPAP